jgi:hypothetical protein
MVALAPVGIEEACSLRPRLPWRVIAALAIRKKRDAVFAEEP